MKNVKTIIKEFSKDVYKLEISEFSVGGFLYSIYINDVFDKNYRRLDRETKEFFNI